MITNNRAVIIIACCIKVHETVLSQKIFFYLAHLAYCEDKRWCNTSVMRWSEKEEDAGIMTWFFRYFLSVAWTQVLWCCISLTGYLIDERACRWEQVGGMLCANTLDTGRVPDPGQDRARWSETSSHYLQGYAIWNLFISGTFNLVFSDFETTVNGIIV